MSARIAMIGAGGVAARHVRVLTRLGARVVGVADPVPAAAQRLAAGCGATAYPDADGCWTPSGSTPRTSACRRSRTAPPERAVLARRAAAVRGEAAGVRPGHRDPLAARLAAAGVVTGTGYHWRCLDTVERARELVADDPVRLAAGAGWTRCRRRPGGPPGPAPAARSSSSSPTCWTWPGCWSARSARSRPGRPRRAASPGDVDDVTAVAARYGTGAVGTFAASSLLPAKRRAGLATVSASGLRLDLSEQSWWSNGPVRSRRC